MRLTTLTRGGAALCLLLALAHAVRAGEPPVQVPAVPTTSPSTPAPSAPPKVDAAARMFSARCAGCHGFGTGTRTGPDLVTVVAWKPADLQQAIKRMEKNVGPLADDEVRELAGLIKDPTVHDRIAAEEARLARLAEASLDPPSPAMGRALFQGMSPLRGGGPSCVSCHAVQGAGGTLGPDLTTVHARLGTVGLVSAIQKSAFKVMKPIYTSHPISAQESVHIASWLAGVGGKDAPQAAESSVAVPGMLAGFIALAAVGLARRPRAGGTRARLISEGTRR